MPFVHGSQGCVAYYRSHLSRHFKEPTSCVSSSMTEDAAVFGGLNNMVDGLANTYNLYKPKMIAVSTTCMAEVIGDDLNAFIKTAKEKGSVPAEFDVPFAHTPAFVGSHITGYDNALKGIIEHFWDGKAGTVPKLEREPNDKINFIGGFDGFAVGNMREIKRIFDLMGVDYTILGDNSRRLGHARPTASSACMTAAPRWKRRPTRSTPRRPSRCRNTAPRRRCQYIAEQGQEVVALQPPDRRRRHRRVPDGRCRASPASRSRTSWTRSAAVWSTPWPTARPTCTARNSRSTAIRTCARPRRVPAGARRRADARAGHQRQQGLGGEGAGAVRLLAVRQGLQGLCRARICGTCARCCSPSRWIS